MKTDQTTQTSLKRPLVPLPAPLQSPLVPSDEKVSSRQAQTNHINISICIPAYNEGPGIEKTVNEALRVLRPLPGSNEVLVVDDGSADSTWDVLQRLAQNETMLRIERHPRNMGLAAAIRTLVQSSRGQWFFLTGADLQWKMDEMPRMLAVLQQGYDVVIGVRREKQYTFYRKIVSESFNLLVAMLWGRHFGDLGSITMARASLWKKIPLHTNSAFVQAERILVAYRNGARITTIPVEHFPRPSGRSSFSNPMQAVRALRELVQFWFSPHSRYRIPDFKQAELRSHTPGELP